MGGYAATYSDCTKLGKTTDVEQVRAEQRNERDGGAVKKQKLTRLIRKCMRGDKNAFSELYGLFAKEIYYLTSKSLFDKADVDDAAQESAIALFNGVKQLRSPYAFHSYLVSTVSNVCSRFNRRSTGHRCAVIDELEHDILVDNNDTPDVAFEHCEIEEAVLHCIYELPQKQQLTLLLLYKYDMSYKDIAKALGVSTNTVGTNILKAKKTLSGMVQERNDIQIYFSTNAKASETKSNTNSSNTSPLSSAMAAACDKTRGKIAEKALEKNGLVAAAFALDINRILTDANAQMCASSWSMRLNTASTVAAAKVTSSVLSSVVTKATFYTTALLLFVGAGVSALVVSEMNSQSNGHTELRVIEDGTVFSPAFTINFDYTDSERLVGGNSFSDDLGVMDNSFSDNQGNVLTNDVTSYGAVGVNVLTRPTAATIDVADGVAVACVIKDSSGAICASSDGDSMEASGFANLDSGVYTIEWTVEDNEGHSGVAWREFEVLA